MAMLVPRLLAHALGMPARSVPKSMMSAMVFKPPRVGYGMTRDHRHVLSGDKRRQVAMLQVRNEEAAADAPTLFFAHGNAEDLGSCERWLRQLCRELRCHGAAFDPAGYGHSANEAPSERTLYDDARGALDSIESENVVVMGRSLGSAVACMLAGNSKFKVKGVVLQSPMLSAFRVVLGDMPLSLPGDILRCTDMIENVECPVMIVHGKKDNVIPFEHAEKLAEKTPNLHKLLLVQASHNGVEGTLAKDYFEELRGFMKAL
ncbi:MAG: hypothetical protein MHM6MM_002332 [Cercozoa sp. M6MM]